MKCVKDWFIEKMDADKIFLHPHLYGQVMEALIILSSGNYSTLQKQIQRIFLVKKNLICSFLHNRGLPNHFGSCSFLCFLNTIYIRMLSLIFQPSGAQVLQGIVPIPERLFIFFILKFQVINQFYLTFELP